MSVTVPSPQSNLTTVKRNIVEYLYALSTGGSAVANITPPSIIVQGGGDAEPGSTLQGTPGTWTGSPTLTYQWLRDGTEIVGETSLAGYTVVDDDRGSNITLDEIPNGVTASAVTSNTIAVDPLAGLNFAVRLQTHNGNNVPLGLWQDVAMTIPATQDFDPVAAWSDELSTSGEVLPQEDTNKQFTLIYEGGVPTMGSDGVDDFLASAPLGAALSQPTTIFALAKNTDTLGSNRQIFSGKSDFARQVLYNDSGNDSIYAGSVLGAAGTVEEWHVWAAIFNGASSILRIDGVQVASGNAGAQGLDGFVLGSNFDSTSNFWAGRFIALMVLPEIPSLSNIELIESVINNLKPA